MEGLTIGKVSLTDQAANDIFVTAIEAGHTYGFGYWAELKGITRRGAVGEPGLVSSIRLRETDAPNRVKRITKKDLEAGIAKALTEPKGLRLSGLAEEYPDGPTAESILQYAMFGEQVYG